MITANTKLTALEILKECGIENAETKFGAMRVRIGGIAGINKPDHLINITPDTKVLEVIVGSEVFDLELSKGNKEDNAEVRVISDDAKAVLEAEGVEATKQAEELQKVKQLAKNIKENDFSYEPANKEEKELFARALELAENQVAVEARQDDAEVNRTTVKSK